MPANANGKVPLVIFVHGGGWISNDKYADMGYMKKTIAEIVSSGFALAFQHRPQQSSFSLTSSDGRHR
ncbi:MAG TPA: hypothetical protein VFD58_35320 [Blastocatellia bacterium]|nr:hypothetical protein [Blastocatellia bacterium]